jgi:hypothetical protein
MDTRGGTTDLSALELLQQEERSLSARRVRLQDRIDFIRAGGGGDGDAIAGQLADLERRERELSDRRRLVHRQIDALSSRLLADREQG